MDVPCLALSGGVPQAFSGKDCCESKTTELNAIVLIKTLRVAAILAWTDCVSLQSWLLLELPTILLTSVHRSGITCNIVIGFIASRVATHWILSTGAFATGISLILFATMPVGATYWGFMFFATVSLVSMCSSDKR